MVSKFKLLMTTDVKSEIWDYSLTLAKALLKNIDAEILIISLGGNPTTRQKEESENSNIKFIFTEFLPDNFNNIELNYDISKVKAFFENTVKEFDPHIVHSNHAQLNFAFNKPCIFSCHSDLLNKTILNNANRNNYQENSILKYKEFINKSLNNADIIVTQTRFVAECLVKAYDLKNNIKVIYNGIDHKPYSDIPENPSLVINGNFLDYKNISIISNLAYKLPDNIKIRILGEVYTDRKLPRNVEFYRNLENSEIQEVYQNSSIYLGVSSYELNGLSSIQAAYSGCAILANDSAVFKELWGDCAYIFEKDNLNSLMKCINNLVENKNFLEITSKNCQAKALSVFNSKRMAFEYINLYKNILKKYQTAEKISRES